VLLGQSVYEVRKNFGVELAKEYKIEAVYIAKEINLAKTAEKLDKNLIGRRREFLIF